MKMAYQLIVQAGKRFVIMPSVNWRSNSILAFLFLEKGFRRMSDVIFMNYVVTYTPPGKRG